MVGKVKGRGPASCKCDDAPKRWPAPWGFVSAAERDELRGAMAELLQRLNAANDVIGRAKASMADLEAQAAAAAEERQRAEQAEGAALAEAEALRDEAADLRVRRGRVYRYRCAVLWQAGPDGCKFSQP